MSLESRNLALIEDDPIMGESMVQRLKLEGATVSWWRSGAEALKGLSKMAPEAVICDIRLPDGTGAEVFRSIARRRKAPPFLFITGYADIDEAVRLMREGARDYITKPFVMSEFLTRLEQVLGPAEPESDPVLGVSLAIREVERFLRRAARITSNLLLTGETGAGKEVCARFLHALKDEPAGPFMAVNCAAMPADLMESELFGHEKGAFTGAHARHLGYAERAGQGTLFLDEVNELVPKLQAKLLRLIESRSFHRLGGEQAIPFKARLICATNTDLAAGVRDGPFREDLYLPDQCPLTGHPTAAEAGRGHRVADGSVLCRVCAHHRKRRRRHLRARLRSRARPRLAGQRPRASQPHRARGRARR